ncbi:ECF RNA polymerase sigma factor SigE [Stieleria maiorica]|uniref:ECF RNA polymerase sigma factor SigE n=1 Tax=Stieleria maiorica TaxID=2795974 RepID=A0A5B9MQ39_9BACT|nr:sigma-70 family RNA polymerase sigma factor [Stieleria maiorica]QEG02510.1 ECF RNA polymerase sigma factor SigE [Stieleria maiorica]
MPNDAPLNAQIRQAARQIAGERESSAQTLAMAQLYDLTADRLVRFAASITRRQHDAEDAVSATMVKVASRPKLLVSADCPWHYLLRMVRNESLVILRSRSRWSAIGSIADRLIGRSINVVERDDENRLVWDALASLPAPQSEVVVLKIWEQLTFAEIAEVLQITPSTAASRYRYALEKLAGKLARTSAADPEAQPAASSQPIAELVR